MATLAQRRKIETRQLLLDAAYQVLSEKGYAGATIDDIVRVSGASKGALYHHFPSKEDLFKALLEARIRH